MLFFSLFVLGQNKRRNEFAKWHVAWLAEWHNYVECNICRMTQRNKLNWKVRPFWRQSICKRSRCFNIDIRWQSKSHEGSLSISLFRTATKILLAFISRAAWQHRYYSTKVGQFNYFFVPFCIFYIFCKPCHMPFPQTHSFKILVFIVRKGFFFCLEYRETLFSCQFCLKRKESTIFNFSYQNHGLKMPIVRPF